MERTIASDVLDPPVPSLLGVLSVVVARTETSAIGIPSANAHACAAFVWMPYGVVPSSITCVRKNETKSATVSPRAFETRRT